MVKRDIWQKEDCQHIYPQDGTEPQKSFSMKENTTKKSTYGVWAVFSVKWQYALMPNKRMKPSLKKYYSAVAHAFQCHQISIKERQNQMKKSKLK